METTSSFNQVYSDYLHTNKAFWHRFSPKPSELNAEYIAVDAMVDFPSYILGNLIIAKYLQSFTGCRILAVVRNPEQLARWKELLISFSVEEAFFAMDSQPFSYSIRIEDIIREKEGSGLRECLLNCQIHGMPVGDLIYDAYLRDTGEPTVFGMNSTLEAYIRQAIQFYDRYNLLFIKKKIRHCVLGHTVYLLYGMLARVAVMNGTVVYGRKPGSSPLTIKQYQKIGDFPMSEMKPDSDSFEKILIKRKEQGIDYANEFLSKRFSGEAAGPFGTFAAYSKDRIAVSRETFLSTCRINNNNPIVFLMCHAFTDSPHSYPTMLHHDFYDWLTDTLNIVVDLKDINWVVKIHPEDKHYISKIDYGSKLGIEYSLKYKHIFLCPDNLNSSSLTDIADMFLTVRGTCAVEFAAMGIPSIVTAQGRFSQLGFLQECFSREQYIQSLARIMKNNILDQSQRDRAKNAIYFYHYVLLVNCVFIPGIIANWWTPFNAVEFWNTAHQSLTTFNTIDDPLYKNFRVQVEHNLKQLLRYDEFPELVPKEQTAFP